MSTEDKLYPSIENNKEVTREELKKDYSRIIECGTMERAEMALRGLGRDEIIVISGRRILALTHGDGSLSNNDKVYFTAE